MRLASHRSSRSANASRSPAGRRPVARNAATYVPSSTDSPTTPARRCSGMSRREPSTNASICERGIGIGGADEVPHDLALEPEHEGAA